MKIIDEIMPKIKAEARLDKDNQTLWIKADTLDGYGRIIIEDGSHWCRIFYDGCDDCPHDGKIVNDSPSLVEDEPNSSKKPNNCEPWISMIIEAYAKGFKDGAEAVKEVVFTEREGE